MGLSARSHRNHFRHPERRHVSSSNNPGCQPKYGKPPFPAQEIAKLLSAKGYHLYSNYGYRMCDYFGSNKFTNLTPSVSITKDDPSSEKKYPWNFFSWHFGKPLLIKVGKIDLSYRLDKWRLNIFGEENLVEMEQIATELRVRFGKEILINVIPGKCYENFYRGE